MFFFQISPSPPKEDRLPGESGGPCGSQGVHLGDFCGAKILREHSHFFEYITIWALSLDESTGRITQVYHTDRLACAASACFSQSVARVIAVFSAVARVIADFDSDPNG